MRANRVKRTLAAGGIAIGTMVFEFSSTGIGRIIAAGGAAFVIYDMEHTGWSIETIRMLMATTRAADTVPMVRVPAGDYHLIARPLDLGAMGIMVPMVETAAQAAQIAAAVRYPPVGRRGAAFGVAHDDYASGDIVASMASANEEIFLMAQIETAAGLDNVEAIAATDGVDCLWIGHFDLTNSLGIPGQFTHPTYLAAVERVLAACRDHAKIPGIMAGDVATGETLLAQGFRAVAYSGDVWIYGQALRQGIDALRTAADR
ncbi:MAG TPA: aldolase/citrate lyase family protein [Thermomicrobiales bacterium]|nr:aldolase/citrate lyase family protein [Thermomicrobiales bacterium]